MTRKVLLAVAPVPLWPVDNGFSLRVTGVLIELAKRWDTVLVAPQSASGIDATGSIGLLDYVPVDLGGEVATMPWQLDIETLEKTVGSCVRSARPQAALLWSGTEVLGFGDAAIPCVADRIDSATLAAIRTARGQRSLGDRAKKAIRAALYERKVVREMSATVVVGEDDARMLRRLSGRRSVYTIPNGVEPGPPPESIPEGPTPTVIFTGVLSFGPNAEAVTGFAQDAWPLVRESVPTARLVIAGRNPTAEVLELERIPGVEVAADVADLRDELCPAWVAVAPMRSGCGIKNKILEAWACGKPVVMSTLAVNGLPPEHGEAGAVADSPQRMAEHVIRMLGDRAERLRRGRAGYSLVAKHHSWAEAAQRISDLLDAAQAGSEGAAPGSVIPDAVAG